MKLDNGRSCGEVLKVGALDYDGVLRDYDGVLRSGAVAFIQVKARPDDASGNDTQHTIWLLADDCVRLAEKLLRLARKTQEK